MFHVKHSQSQFDVSRETFFLISHISILTINITPNYLTSTTPLRIANTAACVLSEALIFLNIFDT